VSRIMDSTDDVQAQVLEGIRKSQTAVIDGVRAWADRFAPFTLPHTSWAPVEELPTPAEVIDSSFDFAAKLLDAQREFAQGLLGATASVRDQAERPVQKPKVAKTV
jgi:hypothetical protein